MYVQPKMEARSGNHCYSGKGMTVTQLVCVRVFVALVIQHAMRMRRIVSHLWPAPLYRIFPNYRVNSILITNLMH